MFIVPKRNQARLGLAAAGLLLLLITASATLRSSDWLKRYPPGGDDPYWFELENDLLFSEEIPLPGYSDAELGKLEYPAIAADGRGRVYVAYDFTSEDDREAICLTSFDDGDLSFQPVTEDDPPRRYLEIAGAPGWRTPVQVSSASGIEYRPRLAVAPDGVVWIVWSARRAGRWNVFARTYADGRLGGELQLTSGSEYDFRPVVLAQRSGRVWVAWERGTPDKNMHIVARYHEAGRWSEEIVVEERPGYAYRPGMVEAPGGSVWFVWDHNVGHNTDVYVARYKDGRLGEPVRVTTHPAIDSKASVAWFDDKLWVAWTANRRGDDGWGIVRYSMVRAFDGESWYEPVSAMGGVDLQSRAEAQSYEFPTLIFDPFGRLYLFTRHDHVFSATYYEDGVWHEPWLLDELGWGLRGLYVHAAWLNDHELWMARRDRRTIFLQKMVRQQPQKKKIRLRKYTPANYPKNLAGVEEPGHRGPTRHGDYRVYYGELHVHTAYSDGSGSFDDLYNLYKNVYRLDFLAITDHDALSAGHNHFSPGEWAYLKALNELYNEPGRFVTLNAYEWTHSTWSGRQDSTVRIGHKNVYFKGGEESPFFNHHGDVAYDVASLFKTLREHEALAFPHHPPWGGITWGDHDPEVQTNYEIVSIHGANEYMGNRPIPHRGGMPGTFAQDGLALGKVFGFVGASDSHGLYFHANEGWRADAYKGGLTGALLQDSLSRERVWQALKERRNYATAGEKHYLEFFINGAPMGSIIRVEAPPKISFWVRAYDILYAYIVRNNEDLWVSGKIGGPNTGYRGLRDHTIPPGRNVYYLRVIYKDGTVAWSSPIWVDYQPNRDGSG